MAQKPRNRLPLVAAALVGLVVGTVATVLTTGQTSTQVLNPGDGLTVTCTTTLTGTVGNQSANLQCAASPSPAPSPSPSPTQTTPPSACSGTQVNPGDNLATKVNAAPPGSTVCIHGGTYNLGSTALKPQSGTKLIGDKGTVGPNGEIVAPVKIVGSAVQVITGAGNNVTLTWLDVSGASGSSACKPSCGRDVGSLGTGLIVSYSRIHGAHTAGLGGNGDGMLLTHDEIDHNGSSDMLGCCSGGVKSANNYEIAASYVHDNVGNGIWVDVSGNVSAHDDLVTGNLYDGVRYECNASCNQSASILHNTIRNNDTAKSSSHAGVQVNSAPKADVGVNVFGGNNGKAVMVGGGRGPVTGATIHDNTLNGDAVSGCGSGVTCTNNK